MSLQKNKIKKIHFVGIKGAGMTPLSIIAKEAGISVTGSDVSESFITDGQLKKAGITPLIGFSKGRVLDSDLVVTTSAHKGLDNIEVKEAEKRNIPVLTQAEALGRFQKGEIFGKKYFGISVAGSHGKTTTSAAVATILLENGMDPSYSIGTGNIPSLGLSGHFGKGKYFIAEADEYFTDVVYKKFPKFYFQSPKMIVVTNIDFDHPDVYRSIDQIREVFLKFARELPNDGVLIACGDGEENRKFLAGFDGKKITYGFSPDNDFILERVSFSNELMFFWVKSQDTSLGQFSTKVFGRHNGLNCLGAAVAGLEVGLSVEQVKKGLKNFSGTERRQEFLGTTSGGVLIYDDYAHHPEEIKSTLSAFRSIFPKHKIISVFQPHMYSRTIKLFDKFSHSFVDADEVIILEVFPSFREKKDPNFSSLLLSDEIRKNGKKSLYLPNKSDVIKYLSSQSFIPNTLIITMGAGDIYKAGEKLIHPVR